VNLLEDIVIKTGGWSGPRINKKVNGPAPKDTN